MTDSFDVRHILIQIRNREELVNKRNAIHYGNLGYLILQHWVTKIIKLYTLWHSVTEPSVDSSVK